MDVWKSEIDEGVNKVFGDVVDVVGDVVIEVGCCGQD